MKQKTEIQCHINRDRSANPTSEAADLFTPETEKSVIRFHRSLPGYYPTPLADLSHLAEHLGIQRLWVKNEAERFDLKAFKVLGASYAMAKYLAGRLNLNTVDMDFNRLAALSPQMDKITFVTATDGNHGRAVAWAAAKLGCDAVVYMPKGSAVARLEAIRGFGAQASMVDGNYDEAVRVAAAQAEKNGWILLQDMSWPEYEELPVYIMQGYATLLIESVEQLEGDWPTHVFVQAGVGSLASSQLAYLSRFTSKTRPMFVVVEPTNAACLYDSLVAGDGKPHVIESDLDTIMAGLACGEPSHAAWEILRKNADAFVTCSDSVALTGMRVLGNPLPGDDQVISGETGAVTTGLVHELLTNPEFENETAQLELKEDAKVLVISTEGDTDPAYYRHVVWGTVYG